MQMGRVMGGAFIVCDWIWRIALVNILWILFTLTGFIIFGVMPATVALFTVVRKWNMKEVDIPISRVFFQTYKKEFLHSNIVGLIMGAIGFFLFYDFRLVMALGGTVQYILSVPLSIIIGLYLITFLYLFPVYVHFDGSSASIIKFAIIRFPRIYSIFFGESNVHCDDVWCDTCF